MARTIPIPGWGVWTEKVNRTIPIPGWGIWTATVGPTITTRTVTSSLNAALAKELTSTSSLNAALAKQLFATASLNARFQKEIGIVTNLDAFLSLPISPGRATSRRTFRPLTARTFKPRIS